MDILTQISAGINFVLLLSSLGWILVFAVILYIIVKTIEELRKK